MAPKDRNGSGHRKGVRDLGDNVVMADFGARRRKEQQSQLLRAPKVPKLKENWAAAEFMEAVIEGADSGRISRGRDYFRAGHVLSVEAVDEQLVGWVSGSQLEPFHVRIRLSRIGESDREKVREQLAVHPDNVKFLMLGEKPLPAVAKRLMDSSQPVVGYCDCPDKAQVCKHIVAVAMNYAQTLSREPLEVLRLRGIDPQPVVQALEAEAPAKPPQPGEPEVADLDARRKQKEGAERTVDADEFWGKTGSTVLWVEPGVEEGHELGDQEHLMDAMETISWTHVDQLENRHVIDRCYEELGLAEPLFDYSRRMSAVREINEANADHTTKEDE